MFSRFTFPPFPTALCPSMLTYMDCINRFWCPLAFGWVCPKKNPRSLGEEGQYIYSSSPHPEKSPPDDCVPSNENCHFSRQHNSTLSYRVQVTTPSPIPSCLWMLSTWLQAPTLSLVVPHYTSIFINNTFIK